MNFPTPDIESEDPPHTVPAGPWKRLFARNIDLWLGATLTVVLGAMLTSGTRGDIPSSWYRSPPGLATLALALSVAPLVIEAAVHLVFGNTLGKFLFGMRVIETGTGEAPSFTRYLRRALAAWVSGMFMGAFGSLVVGAAFALTGTALMSGSGERSPAGLVMVITGLVLAWALPLLAMRHQYRRVSQGMPASYDERGGFEVIETPVSVARLALGTLILFLQFLLVGQSLMRARQPPHEESGAPSPGRTATVPAQAPRPVDEWRNPVTGLEARLGLAWSAAPGGAVPGLAGFRFTTVENRVEVQLSHAHRKDDDLEEFAQTIQERLAATVTFTSSGRIFTHGGGSTWQNEGTSTDDARRLVFVQIVAAPSRHWVIVTRRLADDPGAESLAEDLRERVWNTLR